MGGDEWVARWLFGCSALVVCMVIVGGLTRLTKSGLSMTDWKPQGSRPPMNLEEWEAEFDKYKASPEYKRVHDGMTLPEFKFIFFMEYGHRMLGRFTGLAYALPLLYFASRGRLSMPGLKPRLLGILGLIGTQGLIGWWMVKSGLEEPEFKSEEPKVSPYRLTTHLLSAFAIYTALFTTALKVKSGGAVASPPARLYWAVTATTAIVGLTVASGAFVAGNRAGLVYNEWPLMGGRWVPEDIEDPKLKPKWRNIFENSSVVQFDHRMLAYGTITSVSTLWALLRKSNVSPHVRLVSSGLVGMACCQATLGVCTLLWYVPTDLAATHQAGSLVLFTICLYLRHLILRGAGAGANARTMQGLKQAIKSAQGGQERAGPELLKGRIAG